MKQKASWYPNTSRRKSRMETPSYNAVEVVVRQAIKDDLANSGLRVRVVIRKKMAGERSTEVAVHVRG
jgi:hypothetical protein